MMLVPAIMMKQEIEEAFNKLLYTDKLMWYDGCIDNFTHEVTTEEDKYAFAIVREDRYDSYELIGYISFRISWYISEAFNFGLIKFAEKDEQIMASALCEVVHMLKSFKVHRIDFRCVVDNPVFPKYCKLVSQFVGAYNIKKFTLKDCMRDRKGKYHDMAIFELIRYS